MEKLISYQIHKEDTLTYQIHHLTASQECLEDALQQATSSIQSPSDVQFLLSRSDIVSMLEAEENYSVVLEPEAQFLMEFTKEKRDRMVRIKILT